MKLVNLLGVLAFFAFAIQAQAQQTAATVLVHTLENEGLEATAKKNMELKANNFAQYAYDQEEVQTAAWELINEGQVNYGIALLRANTDQAPTSATFEQLADAYVVQQNASLASTMYKKALSLDPGNTAIEEKLSKLK